MKKLSILFLILMSLIFLCSCEADLAPNDSAIEVLPDSVSLGELGIPGTRTFVPFLVVVTDRDGQPIQKIDVEVTTFFLRVLDEDGNFVEPPVQEIFTTDENGEVQITVEAPLAEEYTDQLFVRSGAITSDEISITASAPSS